MRGSILFLLLVIGLIITPSLSGETEPIPLNPITTPSISTKLPENRVKDTSLFIKIKKTERYLTFSDWINERSYGVKIDIESERQTIREQWNRAFGIDIFYPYFKIREMKIKTEDKTKFKLFRLKGKAKIEENEVKYILKTNF